MALGNWAGPATWSALCSSRRFPELTSDQSPHHCGFLREQAPTKRTAMYLPKKKEMDKVYLRLQELALT